MKDAAADGLAARLASRQAELDRLRGALSADQRAALERRLRGAAPAAAAAQAIPRRTRAGGAGGEAPTSFAQQRLWFLEQLEPGTAFHNVPTANRLAGRLDLAALAAAFDALVRRHEALRTTFADRDGQPVQILAAADAPRRARLAVVDLGALPGAARQRQAAALAGAEARRPFDLARGPLVRASVLRLAAAEHLLLLNLHHLVTDGWSDAVLVSDLVALYRCRAGRRTALADTLPPLPLQYADFAVWQRQWLSGERLERQLAYWRQRLAGLGALDLPLDRPRPAVQSFRGARHLLVLPEAAAAALAELARRHGMTLFMILLAGCQALLARLCGQTDIAVGAPVANRDRPELAGMVGFLVNTLVLRSDLGGEPPAAEVLGRVREAALGAYAHQDVPFEKLVEELMPARDLSRNPLFQVLCGLQNQPPESVAADALTLACEPLDVDSGAAKFDLGFHWHEAAGCLVGMCEYQTDLFDRATVRRFMDHYASLLGALAAPAGPPPAAHPLLDAAARHQLLAEWSVGDAAGAAAGRRDDPAAAVDLMGPFFAAAARQPQAVAVSWGDAQLSYGELALRTRRLARRLAGLGAGPGTVVGIAAERSPEMIVAVAGTVAAGAAYLPLDPSYPAARLGLMHADAGAAWVLTQQRLAAALPVERSRVLCLDGAGGLLAGATAEAAGEELPRAAGGDLAYVIYTSGSTGRPKGVALPRAALAAMLAWQEAGSRWPGPVTTQFAALSFDVSSQEIFSTLRTGGRLVLVPEAVRRDAPALLALLEAAAVERLFIPFVALRQLAEVAAERRAAPAALREVLTAGEQLQITPAIAAWFETLPGCRLENQYGPSESNQVAVQPLRGRPAGWPALPPIGRPVGGSRLQVLDRGGRPVPIAVTGELYIGGVCLARGYVGRPEVTAERFVPDPLGALAGGPGARLYRTGDLARWRADGTLDFLGRCDQQVKVRGFRVEPGEIEVLLASHPEVAAAAVAARSAGDEEVRLVAWVVAAAGAGGAGGAAAGGGGGGAERQWLAALRGWLGARLPEHMVPGRIVRLAALPLTPSGKLDRQALPAPAAAAVAGRVAPRTPLEELLAGIWSAVLGVEPGAVGVADNFFEQGGHSLLGTRLMSRLRSACGVELPMRALFETPTLAGLAAAVDAARRAAAGMLGGIGGVGGAGEAAVPPLGARPRPAEVPLSFAQERLWFLDQLEPGGTAYNLALSVALHGRLAPAALIAAVAALVRRHEALRTRFPARDGRPRQEIAAAAAAASRAALPVVDLAALPAPLRRGERDRLAARFAAHRFDLARGPLAIWALLRVAPGGPDGGGAGGGPEPGEHVFVVVQHHIVTDGWSMGVMLRELAALYAAFAGGAAADLAPPLQYADFALWQRERLEGGGLAPQLAYWRERLAGELPVLDLPGDRPASRAPAAAGGSAGLGLAPELSARIGAAARRAGATPFMLLLAAWQALLHRLSGQDDLLVGVPIAGRNRAEVEGTLGFFVNTLVLRGDLGGNPRFADLVARVRDAALGAYDHQDLPFERLVALLQPQRDLDRTPLFQVFFNHLNLAREPILLPGLTLEPMGEAAPAAKFDLSIYLAEAAGGFRFDLLYDAGRFAPARVAEMLAQLELLLHALLADPELGARIDDVPLVTAGALAVLPDAAAPLAGGWLGGLAAGASAGAPVHELVARQARRHPARPAIVQEGETWSFGELAAAAARLARHLIAVGLAPGAVVAIAAERRAALAWAVLGTLEAGCAFLLLDGEHPPARRAAMLRLGGAQALVRLPGAGVLEAELAAALAALPPGRVVEGETAARLGARGDASSDSPAALPGSAAAARGPEDAAYVAFTSGSTGEPKAILGPQAPLTHFLAWQAATFGLAGADRFSLLSGLGHDPLLRDLLAPLALGATLCVPPAGSLDDGERLVAWLAAQRVTVAHLTPALARLLAQAVAPPRAAALPDLRWAFLGGDRLRAADVAELRRLAPGAEVVNFYGATETPQAMGWYAVPAAGEAAAAAAAVPLGRGIDAVQLLVRNQAGSWAGIGELGEIVVRSPYLARGYLGDAALSAARFLADPAGGAAGARLYRTGDLGRHALDGGVELTGRADRQVKVRGLRIELDEIEAALAAAPAVAAAAVVVAGGADDALLVAFFVPRPAAAAAGGDLEGELRRHLAGLLPRPMLPAAILRLDRLPLTPNRKLDRRALLRRWEAEWADPARAAAHAPPRDPVEDVVAAIWEEVLGAGRTGGRVGVHDNFFALGGHSLLAAQVVSRLRQALAVEVPLRELFESPTVASLARAVAARRAAGVAAGAVPPPLRGGGRSAAPPPLSFAQESLWLFEQLTPGTAAYNMPAAVRLRGPLRPGVLAAALAEVACRHETLRTAVVERASLGLPGPGAVQIVAPAAGAAGAAPVLPLVDLAALPAVRREAAARQLAAAAARRAFALEQGPLWRACLLRLAAADQVLLLTVHHLVCDGWSLGVMAAELGALYGAFAAGRPSPLPPLAVQYADYALWQRRWLDGAALAAQLAWWRQRLAGAPARLALPTDRPRPLAAAHRGARLGWQLPAAAAAALHGLASRHGATPFMLLLAGWQALLARLSGQEDLVVGLMIAQRNRVELEPLIGFFVNLLALRAAVASELPFRGLLLQARDTTLAALDHQDVPFERLVAELRPERAPGHGPLFQVVCTLQDLPLAPRLPGLAAAPFEVGSQAARFDLTLSLATQGGGIGGYLEYDAELFDAATAARLLGGYERLLGAAAAAPELALGELALLSAAERHQLLREHNDSARPLPGAAGVHELVLAQAARAPAAVAAGGRGLEALCYGDLAARSAALARRLRAAGVGPEVRVAVCAGRSPDLLVALLAVLRAGGAYVPLDAAQPRQRLGHVLTDSGAAVVLAERALLGALPPTAARLVLLDAPLGAEAAEGPAGAWAAAPLPAVAADNLAYVIYTSGSTGRPKGVAISHRAVVNYLAAAAERPGLAAGDVMMAVTTLAFDIAVSELWLPLVVGARIALVSGEAAGDAGELAAALAAAGATCMQATPATWSLLVEGGWTGRAGLRIWCGGEALPRALAGKLLARAAEVWNLYGPTETTVWSARLRVTAASGPVPLGRPLANTALHLLDAAGRLVAWGAAGELAIGGAGLARGYHGRPELTAERFVPDPFGPAGGRLYRTGDLARRLGDGTLEFLGRFDHQVKVRGFRIELGEIEAVLGRHPAVRECVVVARREEGAHLRLIAYLVAPAAAAGEWRAWLAERLPPYMVPAAFVPLAALPRSASGKVDRQALPAPPRQRAAAAGGETPAGGGPRTAAEAVLVRIWEEVLGVAPVAVEDNFFELGGDSILSLQVASRALAAGLRVRARDLFRHQTVARLAAAVEGAGGAAGAAPLAEHARLGVAAADLAAVERDLAAPGGAGRPDIAAVYPLTPMQQGMLFHCRLAASAEQAELYVVQYRCTLRGALDLAAFRAAWQALIDRHAVLRTSFHWTGLDRPLQVVHRRVAAPLAVENWRRLTAAAQAERLAELRRADRRRGFDPRRAPLLRVTLARAAEDAQELVFSYHHLLLDGWSTPLLFGELLRLYAAAAAGERAELPAVRPFRDYVEWLGRQDAAGAEAFWRHELDGFTAATPLPLEALPAAGGAGVGVGGGYTRHHHLLAAAATGALQRLARRHHLTLGTLVQGAWALLLARHAGAGEVLFGAISSGRPAELEGAEGMLGLFIATLPVRVAVPAAAPLLPWLAALQENLARLRELEHCPLADIQRWSAVPRGAALFDSLVIFENYPVAPAPPPGRAAAGALRFSDFQAVQSTNYPLSLVATLRGDRLHLRLAFDGGRHAAAPVARALRQLAALLGAMAAAGGEAAAGAAATAGAALGDLPALGPAERHQLLREWSDTGRAPAAGPLLHRLFEQRAAGCGGAAALVFDDLVLSYGEVAARAARLAAALRRLGVGDGGRRRPDGRESLVAIALPRTPWLPIAMLAVWQAGGAFLPLDPDYPVERLAFMLADSGAELLLGSAGRGGELPSLPGVRRAAVEELWAAGATPAGAAPAGGGDPPLASLAYVIYTSGSTGRPKGVMVEHRGLANLVREQIAAFAIGAASRVLQLASASFDASLSEIWTAWVAGAALVMLPDGALAADAGLLRRLRRQAVSVATFPPSLLDALPAAELPALATLVVAGEAANATVLARWAPGRERVINGYGPTEFTVCATLARWRPDDAGAGGAPLLGRPIANTAIRLLDPRQQPVAIGAAGELGLAGSGLARGYLGRPDLTAAAFLPDPWSAAPGGRLYRTGDLGAWTADGRLAYLGRRDAQVKVRGVRVEIGEVEAALARHPEVRACAVAARRDAGGQARLAAWVVTAPGAAPVSPADGGAALAARLRAFLQRSLPEAMVPGRFVELPALPRTPNGKLDRRALPDPAAAAPRLSAPPGSALERWLAGLWSEILGVAGIGVDDDFFELGGHSLAGATVVGRLQEALGEIVHVVAMYDAPTVGALAAYLTEHYPGAVARLAGEAPRPAGEPAPGPLASSPPAGAAELAELRAVVARGRGVAAGGRPQGGEAAPRNPPALFVLSPPRSGSTLLRVMLAGHPRLFAPPELELLSFDTLAGRRAAFAGRNRFWLEGAVRALMEIHRCAAGAAEALLADMEAAGAGTQELYRRLQEWVAPRLLVDKTPSYALDPRVLARAERLFAGARYIHLVRHPLAVMRSFEEARLDQVFFRFPHRFARRQLAELVWAACEENILGFLAAVEPGRHHRLRFEDLVARPEAELRRLCLWLGIDFDPAMARPYDLPGERMTDGIHPWSRMLGDVKFHQHAAVDATAGGAWRAAMRGRRLGGPAAALAARLGWDEAPPAPPPASAARSAPAGAARAAAAAWVPLQPRGSLAPLVCLPPAGGDSLCYRELALALGGERPVYGLQAAGVAAGETPLDRVEDAARRALAVLRDALPGAAPASLLGWSFGGVVAYEMACRLAAAGRPAPLVVILDAVPEIPPPAAGRSPQDDADLLAEIFGPLLALGAAEIRALPAAGRLAELCARAGAAGRLPAGFDLAHAQRLLAVYQASQTAARAYRPGPYGGRLLLIRPALTAERQVRAADLGWGRLANAVEVREVPGRHDDLIAAPHAAALADCLRRGLAAAEAAAGRREP